MARSGGGCSCRRGPSSITCRRSCRSWTWHRGPKPSPPPAASGGLRRPARTCLWEVSACLAREADGALRAEEPDDVELVEALLDSRVRRRDAADGLRRALPEEADPHQ